MCPLASDQLTANIISSILMPAYHDRYFETNFRFYVISLIIF